MKITVEDRRAVSAEVTVEMLRSYMGRSGWEMELIESEDGRAAIHVRRSDRVAWLPAGMPEEHIAWIVETIAREEQRQPSAVLSDIVGYQVGLDRGRASVLRNSASARVVEAREALARVKPHSAVEHERARVRLAQAEADLVAATRALEVATAAPGEKQ